MNWLVQGLRSSIGLKFLMAATGILLFLFVVGHMLGNLQIFLGPDTLNGYAKSIKSMPLLLWGTRVGLLATVILHVACAATLTRRNREARPIAYAAKHSVAATYASRTMFMTGVIVLAFISYHLLHFTLGVAHREHFDAHDVYSMVVRSFQSPAVSLAYVAAMIVLVLHLRHGVGSFFQSLGFNQPRYVGLTRGVANFSALVILVGNCSMPLACLFGILRLPGAN